MQRDKSSRRADRVWDRLIQCWGTRVAEAYGAEMPKPWLDAVEDLTDEQIAHGLKRLPIESPQFPPTLGQFIKACSNMPIAQAREFATVQEQLCAYASMHCHDLAGPKGLTLAEYGRPWSYVYREWWDPARPKGMERCSECLGLVIELHDGKRLGWSVAAMIADQEGFAKMRKKFLQGPRPSEAQIEMHRAAMQALA